MALMQRKNKIPPSTPAPYSHLSPRSRSPQRGRRRRSTSHSRSPPHLRRKSTSRSRSPAHIRGRSLSASRPWSPQGRQMSRSPSPQRDRQSTHSLSPSPVRDQRDASRPSSPLPVAGRKRSYSSSDEGLNHFVKAQKVSEGSGRPKASDYDDVAKEVILCATSIYRCLVSTSNAFPTPSEEGELIKLAWSRANEETSQEVPIALTPVISKVVRVFFFPNVIYILLICFVFRFPHAVVK
jgi:hypothetical protein